MLTRDAIGGTPGFGHAIVTVDVVVLSGRIFPVGRDLHLGRAFDNSDKTEKKITRQIIYNFSVVPTQIHQFEGFPKIKIDLYLKCYSTLL